MNRRRMFRRIAPVLILVAYVASVGCAKPCNTTADLNGDGNVTTADFAKFIDAFQDEDPIADMNCDGVIDQSDADEFERQFNAAN